MSFVEVSSFLSLNNKELDIWNNTVHCCCVKAFTVSNIVVLKKKCFTIVMWRVAAVNDTSKPGIF